MAWQAAAGKITMHQAAASAFEEELPSEGARAARVYLAAQLQAACVHPEMTTRRGVDRLERAVDACPQAAGIPEKTTGRSALLLLCDRDDISAAQLQVLAKIILSTYPAASSMQVRMPGPGGRGFSFDTNPVHEVVERADATPALLDVLLDGVNEHTLGQRDAQDRTPLHTLLANSALRVHEVPMSLASVDDAGPPGSPRGSPAKGGKAKGKAPRLMDAAARKQALSKHEGWLLAFMLGAEGGTDPDKPRLAMQDIRGLIPLHTLLCNRNVPAPFLAPSIAMLVQGMDYENSRRDHENSFLIRDERNYGVLHTLCERRDVLNHPDQHAAVECVRAIVGVPDLSLADMPMIEVRDRGIQSHPAATVLDGSRPQGYYPLHTLVKTGSIIPADRLAKLLVPVALAHREAVRVADVSDFDRCALHVIADRRDVDSHLLKALVQACPEASIAKDNRGCTPLHSLLENTMLSHAYNRQEKVIAELKYAIKERDAAIPLQSLLRRFLVRGAPPQPPDPGTAERLQKKQAAVDALRPWLEPLLITGCSGPEVVALAELEVAAAAAAAAGSEAGSAMPEPEPEPKPAAPLAMAPGSPIAALGTAETVPAEPVAQIFLRWEDVEVSLVELGEPAKLRDAAKLVKDEGELLAFETATERAEALLKMLVEADLDCVGLVKQVLTTGNAQRTLAIAKLKPRLNELVVAEDNDYIEAEEDLNWETDAVPALRLIMNMKQMRIQDPETWGDIQEDSSSGDDDGDAWDESSEGSEPETLDQMLLKAMLALHEAETEAENMVKILVEAGPRDEDNKRVDVTMEENSALQIPLRALLNNKFVAPQVMARLLGFLTTKNRASGTQPGAKPPFRTPLLLLCADDLVRPEKPSPKITAEMIIAIVTACPAAASVTDAYEFDALRVIIERQGDLRLDASRLTAIITPLAKAYPDSVVRPELILMDDAANSKIYRKEIGTRCGRSPVHMICERDDVTPEMVEALVSQNEAAYILQDELGRTPLHTLCENPQINGEVVRTLLKTGRAAASMANKAGLTPLQSVCKSNPGISVEVLQLLVFVHPDAAGLPDERGQTAVHLLCMRNDITGKSLELMLQVVARAAHNELITQDYAESATALHYLCRRGDVTPQMLAALLRNNTRVASKQDRRKRTALHWLCMDPKASASTSDATDALIAVFTSKRVLDLPMGSPLPQMPPQLDLEKEPSFGGSPPSPAAEEEPESEPEPEGEGEDEPEPEHEMENGPYPIVDCVSLMDLNGRTALHYLCRRDDLAPWILEPLVAVMAKAKPKTVYIVECAQDRQVRSFKQGVFNPDRTPLHDLLRRDATFRENVGGGITAGLLSALFNASSGKDHRRSCGAAVDFFGRTCFYAVCSRDDLNPQLREELLRVIIEASLIGGVADCVMIVDDFSDGGLHTLCDYTDTDEETGDVTASITPSMVALILAANPAILDLVDIRGMTAFMHLCANPALTPALVAAWVKVQPSDKVEIPRRLSGDHAARLRAIYLSTDLDGNGALSAEELSLGIQEDGELTELLNLEDGSPENVAEIFKAMDGNSDGLIDMNEFVDFFESEPVVLKPPVSDKQKRKIMKAIKEAAAPPELEPAEEDVKMILADAMRRTSTQDNDVVVSEDQFMLPEELAAMEEPRPTDLAVPIEDEEPQGESDDVRAAYSNGWRALRADTHKQRVDLDGSNASKACKMQLVVKKEKARDRWKVKGAGGVKNLTKAAFTAASINKAVQTDYPYMMRRESEHGRTALHWLCMNESISQNDLILMLVAIAKLARSTISMPTVTSPMMTPLHMVVTRHDAHEDMVRPLVRFNPEGAAVRDELGWLPLQMVYTKPGFGSRAMAIMLDLVAAAYPEGVVQPAPMTMVKNRCSLHVICGVKDICVESLRALIANYPKAAALRDEHTMAPLHYLCKNTGICLSFRSLEEQLPRSKEHVKAHSFTLVHLLLEKFLEELCKFVHHNHPDQDPNAAEEWRVECGKAWASRELPPSVLVHLTRDPAGRLGGAWRDCACDVLDPLARRIVVALSHCPPQSMMPSTVFKLYFPNVRVSRPNWHMFAKEVSGYMAQLLELTRHWRNGGEEWAAQQSTQTPAEKFQFSASRAAAYYAKSDLETARLLEGDRVIKDIKPNYKQLLKYSPAADAVQYPSLSAWPAERSVQYARSGNKAALGLGRAATVSQAALNGRGSVGQDLNVNRQTETLKRRARRKPSRASGRLKKQQAQAQAEGRQAVPVFHLKTNELLEEPEAEAASPNRSRDAARAVMAAGRFGRGDVEFDVNEIEIEAEEKPDLLQGAESTCAESIAALDELQRQIDGARNTCVQMIEELANAEPTAAKMTNRYGRTPTHYLALNTAIPAMFLPAMLRSLLKCDPRVLFIHALATIDTVVRSEPVRLQNQRHRTPLHCVIERGDLSPEMVQVCVDAEGTAAIQVNYWGDTPLMTLLMRTDLESGVMVAIAKILAGASPSSLGVVNTAGLTALHLLVESCLPAAEMTTVLRLFCGNYSDAIPEQERSDTELDHVGPMTEAARAAFSFKPDDRLDVRVNTQGQGPSVEEARDDAEAEELTSWASQWYEAVVVDYTPQGQNRPWQIEFTYVDGGARGVFMLDDDHHNVRRAHYRVNDIVDVTEDGRSWKTARVTKYMPQHEILPWRVAFEYTDSNGKKQHGALMLDDDFEKIRIHQAASSLASVKSAAWCLRAAAKLSNQRQQKQSEMRHSRQTRRKLEGTTHRTVLHMVCTRADVTPDMIKAVMRDRPNSNKCAYLQDAEGFTALHRLCWHKNAPLDCIQAYMNGINANDGAKAVAAQNKFGATPLHYLCAGNRYMANLSAMIAALVNVTTDACVAEDEQQCTPLHYLVLRPDVTPQMVDALITQVPECTGYPDTVGRTALHKLAGAKHLTIPLLLSLLPPIGDTEPQEHRAKISKLLACAEDAEGRTALHMVCRRRADFDVDEYGDPILDLPEAVRCISVHCDGDAMMAQEKVRLGASQEREYDRTALHDAVLRHDVSERLIRSLLIKEQGVGSCYDIHGSTALHLLLMREDLRGSHLTALLRAYTDTCIYASVAHVTTEAAEDLRLDRVKAGINTDDWFVAPPGLTGFQAAELRDRKTCGWTPMHELALRSDLTVEMIEAMGAGREIAGKVQNNGGRTPLHTLLSRVDLFQVPDLEAVIDAYVKCNPEAVGTRDRFGLGLGRGMVDDRTPLHYICERNDLDDPYVLRAVFSRFPSGAMVEDRSGRLPVHLLLRRDTPLTRPGGKPAGLLAAMISIAPESISYRCIYYRGATSLHLLAQRADCTIGLIQTVLLGGVDDSSNGPTLSPTAAVAAMTKITAIDTPTALRTANPSMATPYSQASQGEEGNGGDDAGWTPLHELCVNPAVTTGVIHMLASAVPAAARVSDVVGRLPIHLLLENAHGVSNSDLAKMLTTLGKVQPNTIKTQDRVHKRTQVLRGAATRGTDAARASQARAAKQEADAMLSKRNWLNRTPLHVAAARPGVSVQVLTALLNACPNACKVSDVLGCTALHRLVLNPSVTVEKLQCMIQYGDGALMQQNHWGRTPLASLAFNHDVKPDDLAEMMGYVARQYPPAMMSKDIEVLPPKEKGGEPQKRQDRTPLLVLCERSDVTPKMLEKVLEVEPQAALVTDGYGATPTLTISRRKDISTTLSMELRAVVTKFIEKATVRARR